MIKLCKYLSTMWNRTDSRFVAGLNNIPDRFLCKADFILSRHFTLLHSRFVKPPDWIWELFKKIILATGRDQETVKWEKRNFIPKQNTHDLFVGTLSIGIPSYNNNMVTFVTKQSVMEVETKPFNIRFKYQQVQNGNHILQSNEIRFRQLSLSRNR